MAAENSAALSRIVTLRIIASRRAFIDSLTQVAAKAH
jgi:hypothetical protein